MTTKYEVIFINNSSYLGDVCIFQEYPNINDPNFMTLAWIAKKTNPDVTDTFTWDADPCFVWCETGELVSGITFSSSQVVKAEIEENNTITFTKKDGAFQFINLETGKNVDGKLYIICDNTIPLNQASVGIGMAGSATFVAQAAPNLMYGLDTRSSYKITFGNFTQGEVIDPNKLYQTASIDFPVNVYSMTAILNADNTWTIAPTE
ncbi:hypothetical protein KORDIASMS9_02127 [Kordia sp. SMS9]|uniref:protein rhiA n=1 Tax=Kordia sp. SMS9 TaxID=2282170 RepID=UPI000E0D9C34|nr:protein rhiA [Kordia sp. SMS9]AXG69899.1 hypothetical protein KORDIASMS9_02127 [Kordia sp. SMS9]